MPHKNIVVTKNGKVSEETAAVVMGNNVTFYPSDTDQTITISFLDAKNPFNWSTHSKTAAHGQPILDTAMVVGEFKYKPSSSPGIAPSDDDAIRGVPKLIVDPGPLVPPGDGELANPKLIVDGG